MAAKETFADKLAAFLAITPSLPAAQAAVDQTVADLAALRERLADATQRADDVTLAAADGMSGADTQRDKLRAEARELRDRIHDTEALLAKRRERLADAQAADKARAIEATWGKAGELFARRTTVAGRIDQAVADLANASEDLRRETALIRVLFGDKAQPYMATDQMYGHLRIRANAALLGRVLDLGTKTAADIAQIEHETIRDNVEL